MATHLRPILVACLLVACGGDDKGGTQEDGVADVPDVVFGNETDVAPTTTTTNPPDVVTDASDEVDAAPCPGCFGAPCDDNTDCNSGYCLEGPDGQQCSRTCIDTCEPGYSCRPVGTAGGDPVFLCVYDHLTYCKPCHADSDCEIGVGGSSGARCVLSENGASEGSFCRTPCDSACPSGGECRPVTLDGTAVSLCRPLDGTCECSLHAVTVGASTDCAVTNGVGTCEGERSCSATGLSACDASTPAAEACNGADDDCDGATDEDFPTKGQACDGTDSDSCMDGVAVCNEDGTLGCTDDAAAKVEICNGLDEDCDGQTDEDFPQLGAPCDGGDTDKCTDGTFECDGFAVRCNDDEASTVELCNGADDNCDGQTDEGFPGAGQPCDGDDADLCKDGHLVCDVGTGGLRCDDDANAQPELCNGVDDDCDTAVDEGFENKNQPCDGADADGCKDGFLGCSPDGLSLVCSDDVSSRVEVCNDIDDDCLNGVDDNFPQKNQPCDGSDADKCPDGVWICGPDGGLACTDNAFSATEICNDADDDCDGSTDEDFPNKGVACDSLADADACADGHWVCDGTALVCDDNATSIAETCNGVDDDCDGLTDLADPNLAAPLNPNQNGACAGSTQVCTLTGFVPSYTGVPGYGLSETPDGNYADENCDGIDGDEARAVFVKKGGNDGAGCTKAEPCLTINGAIAKLGAKTHVYVQAGTYDEIVDVTKSVEIYGGFDSQWRRRPYGENRVTIRGAKHGGDQEWMAVRVRATTLKLADLVVQGPNVPFDDRSSGRGRSSYGVHAVNSTVTLERVEVSAGNAATGATGNAGGEASQSTPGTAGSGGAGEQALDVCDDDPGGAGAGGATNSSCSSGTAGGSGGRGGQMDTLCEEFCFFGECEWVCDIFGYGVCRASNGASGSSGAGSSAGGGGAGGQGARDCSGVGGGNAGGTASQGLGGGAGARGGSLASNYWYGGNGGAGTVGSHGSGGGGGGGAGGCDRGSVIGGEETPLQNSSGPGGGGGGAGGCAAPSGGAGGGAGGSSIAVFASGGSVTSRNSRLIIGAGGGGGAGGTGGRGQPGGTGGSGGSPIGTAQVGGSGGRGGDGAASGGGGGGAGGHALGVLASGATISLIDTTTDGGTAGSGGAGGDAPTAAGAAGDGVRGQDGRVDSNVSCQSAGNCGI